MLEPLILLLFIWLEHLQSTQQTNFKHAPKILSFAVFPPRLSFWVDLYHQVMMKRMRKNQVNMKLC